VNSKHHQHHQHHRQHLEVVAARAEVAQQCGHHLVQVAPRLDRVRGQIRARHLLHRVAVGGVCGRRMVVHRVVCVGSVRRMAEGGRRVLTPRACGEIRGGRRERPAAGAGFERDGAGGVELRQVLGRLGAVVHGGGAHHAHVAEGVADLRDQHAELCSRPDGENNKTRRRVSGRVDAT